MTGTLQHPLSHADQSRRLPSEALPFQIRVATSDADFSALCQLRASAYGRHEYNASLGDRLCGLDDNDRRAVLLIAEEKETGTVIGTIRMSSSLRGTPPIPAGMVTEEVQHDSYCYVDRFAAASVGIADVVALAIIKAQWHWAQIEKVRWILGAALPPLARKYRMVGLRGLKGAEAGFAIPSVHAGKYAAMGERLVTLPTNLRRVAPFLAPFFLEKHHPDIRVGARGERGAVAWAEAA